MFYQQIWLADWLIVNNPNKPRVQEGDYIVEEPDDWCFLYTYDVHSIHFVLSCKYTVVRSLLFRFKIRIFLRPHSTKNVQKSNSVDWKVLSILLNLSYVGGPAYTHITSFMQQCYKCFLGARMLRLRKDVYSYIKCSFNSILPYSYFLVTVRSNFLLNSNV